MPSWRLGVTSNYFRLAVISWANSIFPFYITGKKAGSPSASVRNDSGQRLVSTARSLLLSPRPHKVYMRVLSLLINNVQIPWPHRVTQRWCGDLRVIGQNVCKHWVVVRSEMLISNSFFGKCWWFSLHDTQRLKYEKIWPHDKGESCRIVSRTVLKALHRFFIDRE